MTPTAGPHPAPPWWVPVAEAGALSAASPLAALCFGHELVLWRGATGQVHAFTDRCPHRGASLSRGRIVEGGRALECSYHGWRFEGSGRCIAIPALPAFTPPASHTACAWQAVEAHGLVWVAARGAPCAAPHLPEMLTELPARRVLCGPFDAATSAPRVVENFLDTAHFGFVHEGSLGSRDQLAVPDYRVEPDAYGRPGVPRYRAWQPRASTAATGGAWVNYRYQVLSPFAALLTKQAEGGAGAAPSEAYALWCHPLDEERTRVWFTIGTSDATRSDEELRAFQAFIFSQDAPVVESQRPKRLPLSGGELHSAADRLSVAYRRWLLATGATFGVT